MPKIQQIPLLITAVMRSMADACRPFSSCLSAGAVVAGAIARLSDRRKQRNQRFNPLFETGLADIVPLDALTAISLVRWRGEVYELTEHATIPAVEAEVIRIEMRK